MFASYCKVLSSFNGTCRHTASCSGQSVKNILVFNCGSSSLKYKVVNPANEVSLLKGSAEKLSSKQDFDEVMTKILREIVSQNIKIAAIGHRWVNGGGEFLKPVVVNSEIEQRLQNILSLAPLHNPHNFHGILTAKKVFPDLDHVAVFDTSFHLTISETAYLYPLPLEVSVKYGLRKYGFHGISYSYICSVLAKLMKSQKERKRVALVLHLGSGCSAAAVTVAADDGATHECVCHDTTMGFTPLDGLMMGTRTGAIDPSVVRHLASELHKEETAGLEKAMLILNKKSGILGVSGVSQDLRDVLAIALSEPSTESTQLQEDRRRCILAIDMFALRAARQMLSIAAAVPAGDTIDTIVFTGGIGEHSGVIRLKILNHVRAVMPYLSMDDGANMANKINITGGVGSRQEDGTFQKIQGSTPVQILVLPTDEELQIARETQVLINK